MWSYLTVPLEGHTRQVWLVEKLLKVMKNTNNMTLQISIYTGFIYLFNCVFCTLIEISLYHSSFIIMYFWNWNAFKSKAKQT